jgi:putative addiction module component (TIGR02574 family)
MEGRLSIGEGLLSTRSILIIENPRDNGAGGNVPDLDGILKDALGLDVQDRARLAEELLASLEGLSEEEAERQWAAEAQRRLQEYHAGCAVAVDTEQVLKTVQNRFLPKPLTKETIRRLRGCLSRRGIPGDLKCEPDRRVE